jgi:hypothetical protein
MPQMHFYVNQSDADALRRKAERLGLSVSAYLAGLARVETTSGWPAGYFERIVGGWQGEPLTRPPQPDLEERAGL